ncbi:phospholipase D-like domain-containing protein [Tundrisphaera sp. TA3]|uniref:phospholipase D-like domain-containing protein n=1 Tax=Tundrisphaera sp. TA3 TaxID=3435775 RepID=UPI003EB8B3CE
MMSRFLDVAHEPAAYLATGFYVLISLVASGHVVLTKRETRAAIGWIGLIWLSPLVGTTLYILLGINRIERKARSLRANKPRAGGRHARRGPASAAAEGPGVGHLDDLARLIGDVTGRPLLGGNEVTPLVDGDQAYPAMIRAIDEATRSVGLCSYIFNADRAGTPFVEALSRAVGRGIEVRVLVDDLGARYDWPSVLVALRRAGVPCAAFLPTLAPGWVPYLNLRNHRKILVVDGKVGFTGGINIDECHAVALGPPHPAHDLHFRIRGPVVADLQGVFADDWDFATGEVLEGPAWFPAIDPAGAILARGVADGPDENRDKLLSAILGALACARSSVAIVTPYFLPESVLISALGIAAMRGVQVDIVLPGRNNLALVKWASSALLAQIIESGCRVWYSPPPFDHTKLMVVDGMWTFFGSGNWDPRSLRLNFEFNLECYDRPLATAIDRIIREKIRRASPITLEEIRRRSLPIRLRDGLARLLTPYL